MSGLKQEESKPTSGFMGGVLKGITEIVIFAFLIVAGWLLHGLVPGGGPGGAPAGMMGAGGPAGPPKVEVATIAEGPAQAPLEHIGHVESIQSVDVCAEISGKIETVHFEEGALVKQGDLLFTIWKSPFEATVAVAQAGLTQANSNLDVYKANLTSAQANLDRAEKYLKRMQSANERSISLANLETAESDALQGRAKVVQAQAQILQGEAAIQQAKANLELAQIDLGYTEIRSPISGQIGLALATKGNLVGPASAPLARIVQVDPIRVVFSVSDRDYYNVMDMTGNDTEKIITHLRLPNGKMYEGTGHLDFQNNEMNPDTGAIAVRYRFDNKEGILVPKSYVNVLTEPITSKQLPHVPQEAVLQDPAGSSVFVVDKDNKVELRRIVPGATVGNYYAVESGLSAGEQVVISGLQKVQDGQTVQINSNLAVAKGQ